jgi:hypothetical protein
VMQAQPLSLLKSLKSSRISKKLWELNLGWLCFGKAKGAFWLLNRLKGEGLWPFQF